VSRTLDSQFCSLYERSVLDANAVCYQMATVKARTSRPSKTGARPHKLLVHPFPAGNAAITEEDPDYVVALARGLSVIRAFSRPQERMALTEVAQAVGLPRATARRCLLTLQALGYVQMDGREFRLAPEVLALAKAYLSSSLLPRIAPPFLERVSERLGESCSVSVLSGNEVIYVARSKSRRVSAMVREVGGHQPAYCTSMGRVLLASLPSAELDAYFRAVTLHPYTVHTVTDEAALRAILDQVRAQQYCSSDQQLEKDLRALAVPLFDASGRTVAALHATTQASRTTMKQMISRFLPVLREAASDMRALLV
jgi:IclR family pca regulon transcriptional regulator